MTRQARMTGVAVTAVLALSACGSTVASTNTAGGTLQNQGLAAPGSAAQPGTSGLGGAPMGAGGAAAGTANGSAALTAPGGAAASGGPGAVAAGGTGAGGAPAAAPAGAGGPGEVAFSGPGVTAKTIQLGMGYCNDCATANSAAGAGGEDPGDTRRYYLTALADVNDRGGVFGRKLVPIWQKVSVSDNIDASEQAACSTWTQDHKVLMMFMQGQIVYECAKKAGVLAEGAGGTGPVYARYPNLFDPADVRLERLGSVTVKAMVRAGWQKPAPTWPTGKIGLITWDDADYHYAMQHGYLQALHDAGLKETDVRYIAVPQSNGSLADASAAISSAVLAFRQEGIDHVFIADGPSGVFTGAGLTLLFLDNAKSQKYYPRYGFNGNNVPGWSNLPADEESGMLAVSSFDTKTTDDAGIPLNPQRERCFALMRKAGLPVGDEQTWDLAINACEIAWSAEAVLRHTRGGALPDMIAAVDSLGTSYRSPFGYGTKLGAGLHDGADLFRNAHFDDGCSCMRFDSKPFEP